MLYYIRLYFTSINLIVLHSGSDSALVVLYLGTLQPLLVARALRAYVYPALWACLLKNVLTKLNKKSRKNYILLRMEVGWNLAFWGNHNRCNKYFKYLNPLQHWTNKQFLWMKEQAPKRPCFIGFEGPKTSLTIDRICGIKWFASDTASNHDVSFRIIYRSCYTDLDLRHSAHEFAWSYLLFPPSLFWCPSIQEYASVCLWLGQSLSSTRHNHDISAF